MLNCHWKPEKKWKEPPKMGGCGQNFGKYMSYLCQKNKMICANDHCINEKHKRAKWSKKNWYGKWDYTQGDFKTCAVVRMIGNLEVTTTVPIDSAKEMKFKDRHNLEELS